MFCISNFLLISVLPEESIVILYFGFGNSCRNAGLSRKIYHETFGPGVLRGRGCVNAVKFRRMSETGLPLMLKRWNFVKFGNDGNVLVC